jgi:glycosyltransferase involved in cell wall biosynthesis
MTPVRIAVVSPVYRNEGTLEELARRVEHALSQHPWQLHFVIDASPDGSSAVASTLSSDPRVVVTELATNVGQHAALRRGLSVAGEADVWVCLDADLQDPPESIAVLVERLQAGDVDAVFAGRRGAYESAARRTTGSMHRQVLARITGLPNDAGAFVAMNAAARDAVLCLGGPSIVAAIGVSRCRTTSVPVERRERPNGRSAWTSRARMRQSARTLAWALSHRWTRTAA